jgi:hypothetical protein
MHPRNEIVILVSTIEDLNKRNLMSATYAIKIRGHLGETMLQAFPGLDAEPSGDCTLLRGLLRDQAALHGVFAQIEALGLELVEVRQLPKGQ